MRGVQGEASKVGVIEEVVNRGLHHLHTNHFQVNTRRERWFQTMVQRARATGSIRQTVATDTAMRSIGCLCLTICVHTSGVDDHAPVETPKRQEHGFSIDEIATAAGGKSYPGGFLCSAREADQTGADASQAARSAAGLESQVEAFEAGAPDVGGGKSSSADAMIYRLGRSAVATAGATGWPAYQQGALEARQKAADTVAVQAVEAGAPDAGGGKSSSQDAMIFKLGRSAVATAGTTGWQAHQQGAFKACQQGGDTAKHNAAIKAVKAGAPTVSGGKSSSKDAMNLTALTVGTSPASEGGSRKSATVYMLSRSDKSPADTWQQREDLALTIRKKGGANRAADTRI